MATSSAMTSRERRSDQKMTAGRVRRVVARGQIMGRRRQSCRALVVVGAVVGFLVVAAGEASASPPLQWSAPVLVDRAVPRDSLSLGLQGMSCPSASLCVAVDDLGNVLTTSDPGADKAWSVTRLRGSPDLTGVSCTSSSLCVAVDTNGSVWSSTRPLGGSPAWQRAHVDSASGLTAVSCPSLSLCVATDKSGGNLFVSANPTGGTRAWVAAHVEPADNGMVHTAVLLPSVSCPSVSLCVAVDFDENVVASTNPTGGARAWTRTRIHRGTVGGLLGVSCPSVSLCVTIDGDANVFRSTNPTGGAGAWIGAQISPFVSGSLTCPTTSLCVFGDLFGGDLLTQTNPGAGLGTLSRAHVDGTNPATALSCPSTSLCVAGDSSGNGSVGEPRQLKVRVPRILVTTRFPGEIRTRRVGRALSVDSGLAVTCPTAGPSCTVTGTADDDDMLSGSYVPIGRIQITVPAGHQRELTFRLSPSAARLLIKNRYFVNARLKIVARTGHGAAVADENVYALAAPGR
jgi:hypothetical protein